MTFEEVDEILKKYFQAAYGDRHNFARYYIDRARFSPSVYVNTANNIKYVDFTVDSEFPFTLDVGYKNFKLLKGHEVTIENLETTCKDYIQKYKTLTNEIELKLLDMEFNQ